MEKMQINHLDGDYGLTSKVRDALRKAADEFVYIGFLLDEAERCEYYKEGGYESIYEYCEAEFGFKRSSTNNFIRVYRRFGEYMHLQERYKSFSYSQLVEMTPLDDKKLILCKPDMTVRELRELKHSKSSGNVVYTVEPEEVKEEPIKAPVQTSGRFLSYGATGPIMVQLPRGFVIDFFERRIGAFPKDLDYHYCQTLKQYNDIFVEKLRDAICSYGNRREVHLEPDLEIQDMGKCSYCDTLCGLEDNYCSDCGAIIIKE